MKRVLTVQEIEGQLAERYSSFCLDDEAERLAIAEYIHSLFEHDNEEEVNGV